MKEANKNLMDLIVNYFYNCEEFGHSEFKVWCEDNLESKEEYILAEKLYNSVENIGDILFN